MEQSKITEERNEMDSLKMRVAIYEAALKKIVVASDASLEAPDFIIGYMRGIAQDALSTKL